ncbi:hypothetical protein BU23DRAFT_552541 [Bimuria novae-zelandiae CBS 107.79]|uniref:Uncharacterized protein n=1 Tax=Bimuria novae-zelandiae CBS 107.79 TaxID=1447943 RepID=A0A6A5VFF4_9PLEO|nr:hypothetical protein BU23DRAFT_552541 [Bimuria novae-zelandiae CBS 107.79]
MPTMGSLSPDAPAIVSVDQSETAGVDTDGRAVMADPYNTTPTQVDAPAEPTTIMARTPPHLIDL